MAKIPAVHAFLPPPASRRPQTMLILAQRGLLEQVIGLPERPPARVHHSMTYLQDMLFIFGGVGKDGSVLGDAHFYDLVTKRWSGEIAREWCCDEK